MTGTKVEMISCDEKQNYDYRKIKKPRECKWESARFPCCCISFFLVICFGLGMQIIYGLLPPVEWNNQAKEVYANVTDYHIYKDTINYSTKTYGVIYVDFPESGYIFEICDKKGYSDSNRQCKSYLKKHYPIGESIKLYYNPHDISDVTLDKINIGGEIAITTLLSFIVIIYFVVSILLLILYIKN